MIYTQIGKRIKLQRVKLSKTQDQLAEEVNISQKYLSQIEIGKSKPRVEVLIKIANALGISLDYLAQDILTDTNNIHINSVILNMQVMSKDEQALILDITQRFREFSERKK
ncbi:MAG: helix-turn-helix transcriptional regulator [Tepidanaerobacteraceae bacterium]|jgi:transcriptional regulator with XRE-family HTH domain|nr:helix-turn-helix transcriptional regulator [Bacteroidales bacterium]MDD4570816.1 helix-turn-helix transcriptional regulator [Tepidanaerobacteraceae bacterium]